MLERLCNWVVLLWGWRRWMVAFLAGALSAVSTAPLLFFPVLWISFPILVWLIDGSQDSSIRGTVRRVRPALAVGWWFGFGYFLAGLWWVGLAFLVEAEAFAWMMPFAVMLLPTGLALFWALAVGLSSLFWKDGWRRVVVLAAFLTGAEWLRATILTGFPWNTIGYALTSNTAFMQTASLVGLYGLTAIAVLVFAAPALLATQNETNRSGSRVFLGLVFFLFAALPLFGFARLASAPAPTPSHADVRLRIVQPAIAQVDKWKPENAAKIFQTYLDLSNRATSPDRPGIVGVTHLIWPESAFPFILTREPKALAAIANLLPPGTTLITGALREHAVAGEKGRKPIYNSIFVIDHEGEIREAFDKAHLVPFGEYLPFRSVLEGLGFRKLVTVVSGFHQGEGRRAMKPVTGPAFSPLICYEAIFPAEILPPVKQGAPRPEWLVNVTNDAWFGNTPGPSQHFHQARLRSVETGLPMVRAANTGISAVVDGYGRIRAHLPLGTQGVIDETLPQPADTTIYSLIGDGAILGIMLILFGIAVVRAD